MTIGRTEFIGSEFYEKADMEPGLFEEKFAIIRELVTPKTKILDLGCYNGAVGDFLTRELDCVVDGVDICEKHIKKSKSLRKRFVFDLNERIWPIKEKYDFVLFTDVIEHVLDTDSFMENVSRLVKEKGCIVLSTPNLASFGRRILLLLGKNPFIEISRHSEINQYDSPPVGHVKYFTLGIIRSLCGFYGFKVETVVPTSFIGGYSNKLIERLFPSLCWHFFVKARKQ